MAYFKVVGEWLDGLKLTLNVWASSMESAEKKFVDNVPKLGFSGYPPLFVRSRMLAPSEYPSGDYVDTLHVVRQTIMEHFNVYLHVVSKDVAEDVLQVTYKDGQWVQARLELEDDNYGMNEREWIDSVFNQDCTECGQRVAYTIATTLAQRPVKLCTTCYNQFFDEDGRRRTED